MNGQWFTGTGFQRGTFYAVGGLLTRRKPAGPVETVELHDGFVIPALGDAHNHFPSAEQNVETTSRAFLQAGVFYVLNPGGDADTASPLRSKLGTPTTIDVIFAYSTFTCPDGHPKPYLEYLSDHGAPFDKAKLNDHHYRTIDSVADIDRKWPQFLSTKPDFVKLILVFSELSQSDDASQKSMGLRPELAAEIVRRAKAAGLRTGAHIEDAADFRNALAVGVDIVMHLPLFPTPLDRGSAYRDKGAWEKRYLIPDVDVKLAAERGVPVVTTIAIGSAVDPENPKPFASLSDDEKRFLKINLANLRHLKDAGVTLLVGSDTMPGTGTLEEVNFLSDTGVFSNLELLKMWSEATPRAIFPQRKIGRLAEGYEANFLVLTGNPIQDLGTVKKIKTRVKQGELQR